MIVFEANYSKKLGLPGYPSHQFSVTIRTELADIHQVNEQSQQIHAFLQSAVDREIQKTGYLPLPQQSQPDPSQSNGGAHFNRNGSCYRQRQHGNRNGGFRNTPRFQGFAGRVRGPCRRGKWARGGRRGS